MFLSTQGESKVISLVFFNKINCIAACLFGEYEE
jgi:hypothetical protein